MSPEDRQQWILEYLRKRQAVCSHAIYRVDVLNTDFVLDYLEATDVKCSIMPFGAPKCPQLGRDLSELYHQGRLQRNTTSIEGMSGYGFPRWVWSYHL